MEALPRAALPGCRSACRTRDRQRLVWYSGAALLLETLIIALWLAANTYSLVVECGWFDRAMGIMAFFGWTAMSTVGGQAGLCRAAPPSGMHACLPPVPGWACWEPLSAWVGPAANALKQDRTCRSPQTFYLHIAQGFSLLPELPSQAATPSEAPRRHVAPSRAASSLVGSTLAGHATAASTQGSHCLLNSSGMGAAAADKDKLAPAEADADADPAGVAGCEQAEAAHAAARAALAAQRHHATPFTEGHLPSSSSGQLGGGASMQSALTNNMSELDSSSSSEEDGAESRAGSQSGKDAASGSGTVARRRHSRRSEHLAMLACLLLWVPVKAALVVILLADLGEWPGGRHRSDELHASPPGQLNALCSASACGYALSCSRAVLLSALLLTAWCVWLGRVHRPQPSGLCGVAA